MGGSKIAVCGNARSGTGSLNQFFVNLGFDSVHEPFHPDKWNGPWDDKTYDICEELEQLYTDHDSMKHLWDHVPDQNNGRLVEWLVSRGIKVVHIERKNRLAQAISWFLAMRTGLWGTDEPGEAEEYIEKCAYIHLEEAELRRRISKTIAQEREHKKLLSKGNLLAVYHEQLYSGERLRDETVQRMLHFAGIHPEQSQLRVAMSGLDPIHKQTTGDIYAVIPNISEIEAAFQVTLA